MKNKPSAARQFEAEGMLVEECRMTGWFVADRRPMRSKTNMHYPFQLVSPDQSQYRLFRKASDAVAALRMKYDFELAA
jgi:hypothetical protein